MTKTELACMATCTIVLLGLVACKAFTDTYNDKQEAKRRQETEQRLEQLEQAVQELILEGANDRD